LLELHSILEFVCPGLFSEERFAQAYEPITRTTDPQALSEIRKLLEVLMLRRLKAEVEKDLPPKYEVRVNCPLSPMQLFWYRRLLIKDMTALEQVEKSEGRSVGQYKRLVALVAQLRKACNHPYLFNGAEDLQSTRVLAAIDFLRR